jgi:protein-S-isoprenylcysteine O-methyltransferase Ste14
MIAVIAGAACLLIGGAVALWRAPVEFAENGRLSSFTFLAAFVAFAGPVLCTFVAAWNASWPLAIPNGVALACGSTLILIGAAAHLTARIQFRSFRLAWGLSSDRLVTTGIYRYCRNPQLVGWALILLGVALFSRSGAALLLAAMFWASCLIYVPVEERFLERRYGSAYKQYKSSAPRYFGFPKGTES